MTLSRTLIDRGEVERRLGAELPGWGAVEVPGGGLGIERRVRFGGFVEAFAFMTAVALAAERLDHHPEWSNVYNQVSIRLSTHDAGGVTDYDFALALEAERALAGLGGASA